MAEAPRRVLLSGYYGYGNVGDDALLEALARTLTAAGTETVAVPAGDPKALPPLPGLLPLARYDWRVMRAFLQDDGVLVSGGGGLLQDATSARSLGYYLAVVALAQRLGRPYVIGWQSLGPLRRRLSRIAARRCLQGAAAVVVRDQRSAETARDLGYRGDVLVSRDLGFLLPPPDADLVREVEARLPPRPRLGICLRPTPASRVAEAIRAWWPQRPPGWSVVWIACQQRDHAMHQQLVEQLGSDGAVATLPPAGVGATQAAVASCDLLLAERLHALIFAILAGVPAVAIDYDPKVAGLAADFGLPIAGTDRELSAAQVAATLQSAAADEGFAGRLAAAADSARAQVAADFRTVFGGLVQAARR